MYIDTNQYLEKAYGINRISAFVKHTWMSLSLIVILIVFWWLKLTGITMAGEAFCGMTEHTHDETCGMPPLVCTLEETEGHVHDDTCLTKNLICELAEAEGHTHGEGCYTATLICTLDEIEGHVHGETCKELTVICEIEENEEHTHGAECKKEEIICTLAEVEGHAHGEECYNKDFICELEEVEGHVHGETCYVPGTEYGCGLIECEPHVHKEDCYGPAEECVLEEHIHTAECYSDINADLETQEQWESTLAGIVPDARPQDNIVAIAQSQLGYVESIKNYEVDENGNKNGYTRYGQWYGNPYGQWNTMFVSFCLHYSQIQGIPLSAGAETMRVEWENVGIYIPAQDAQPSAGDLLFIDKNVNGVADAVAIVTEYTDGQIKVIEGDLENTVAETAYADTDTTIIGYGVIPDMNMVMTLVEEIEPEAEEYGNALATPIAYDQDLFDGTNEFVLYTQVGNEYYAIDASGKAVKVTIDSKGKLCADVTNPETLIWEIAHYNNTSNPRLYTIKNASADNIYLHPYKDNNSTYGVIHNSNWRTQFYPVNDGDDGFTIKGDGQVQYAYLNGDNFVISETDASAFKLAQVGEKRTVWLDGTNGGARTYTGSQNTSYTFRMGATFTLPDECKSPTKYGHALKGWYDVTNSKYYPMGAKVEVTGNMVFYAYWEAGTYDIGEYNEHTINTTSSNEFITTNVFDYGYLFNVLSANPTVTVNETSHSETWRFVTGSGTVNYNSDSDQDKDPTLHYAFVDRTGGGKISEPSGLDSSNGVDYRQVHQGLLTESLKDILFNKETAFDPINGTGIIGKTYVGEGDFLFQYESDPNNSRYGYYFYDSELNAASYNKSNQRFYVYNYLEKTSDSSDADFLPFNSPYANTEGGKVGTYSYAGANNEYQGTTHYNYEIGSNGNVMANMAYGMNTDVRFHLSSKPGQKDSNNEYGNLDINGNQMNFEFVGDDDLWVFVEDASTGEEQLVLDLGGIHQAQTGSINFSTGVVTVNNKEDSELSNALKALEAGEKILHVYYLERGSSASNCSMYFNIAPRYSLNIRKEDVLTQQILDGTEFAIYEDRQCSNLAELWTSKESYMNDDDPAEKFTVANGSVDIWGLVAGGTYYIKEITAPMNGQYDLPSGVIRFSIDKKGITTYDAEMIKEIGQNGEEIEVSDGFTVHGVRIDEENQKAYMTVTNAARWVDTTTTVQVVKIWNDTKDHSNDYITVYLTAKDAGENSTTRRIREVVLSDENNWRYMWTGLPEHNENKEEVTYGVYETYEEGYYYDVGYYEGRIEIQETELAQAESLENNETYLIKTPKGYLATLDEGTNSVRFDVIADEETAMNTESAQWTVTKTKQGQTDYYKFINGTGQSITYSSNLFKPAASFNSNTQQFTVKQTDSGTFKLKSRSNSSYWISKNFNQNNASISRTNSESSAMEFGFYKPITIDDVIEIEDHGFKITNTPLLEETEVKVTKKWSAEGTPSNEYISEQVEVKLLADGVDTGRTLILNLQNGWTDTFKGLPYKDENGNIVNYTVEEAWNKFGWIVKYDPIVTDTSGKIPTYSTTVTNVRIATGPELPSTGSFSRLGYIYCGGGIMLTSLVTAIRLRCKKERRNK